MAIPLREARRKKLIPHNPMDGVEPLASTYKKRGIYTIDEIRKVLGYLHEKGTTGVTEKQKVRGPNKTIVETPKLVKIDLKPYLAVALSAYTGMRLGEVRALRSEQIRIVNEQFGIITIDRAVNDYAGEKSTKGKRTRQVPVPRHLCDELIEMAKKNPHKGDTRVFWSSSSEKNPIASNYVLLHLYKALASIGIKEKDRVARNLNFHSLRHTFNSSLRGRVTEKSLRAVVGHESEAMTDRYTHEQESELLAVGEAVETIFTEIAQEQSE
jgi:integrase